MKCVMCLEAGTASPAGSSGGAKGGPTTVEQIPSGCSAWDLSRISPSLVLLFFIVHGMKLFSNNENTTEQQAGVCPTKNCPIKGLALSPSSKAEIRASGKFRELVVCLIFTI